MKAATRDRLLQLIALLSSELARIDTACGPMPKFEAGVGSDYWDARRAWWMKHELETNASRKLLEEEGARFGYRPPDSHAVLLGGIRSSSTGGWTSAFTNWIRAAEKRLEKDAAP